MLHLVALSLALSIAAAPDPASEQALVEEAWRAAKDEAVLDPPPLDPIPGTFAEHAGPALERLYKPTLELFGLDEDALQRVQDGQAPFDALPACARAAVEKVIPDALQVLAATHARSGKLPVGLTAFMRDHAKGVGFSGPDAAKLAALEMRRELAAHRGEPMRLCVDALAVGREFASGNFYGRMLSLGIAREVIPTCLDVLARVPAPRCEQLDAIRSGWPSMSRALEQEKLWGELSYFGYNLEDETRQALPPEARLILGQGSETHTRFDRLRWQLFGRWARTDYVEAFNRAIAAVDGPLDAANAALAALTEKRPLSSQLIGEDIWTNWLGFARRDRALRTRLTALTGLCHWRAARTGNAWPSPPPLGADARTGKPLHAEVVDATHARIVAEGDPSQEAERLILELALPDPPAAANAPGH